MKKTKTFICSLCMTTILFSSPAFAVVELVKVLDYVLRDVQAVIEIVKNGIALEKSIEQSDLQGLIGAIAPNVQDMGSKIDYKSFVPVLPTDLQGIVSGNGFDSIPQIQAYVEKELKSINMGDGVSQRDVLHKVNELQNAVSVETIQKAKEALAKSNKGPQENQAQLDNVGSARDSQDKASQENAQSIQTLKNDIARNQLSANLLQTTVVRYKAQFLKATQEGENAQNTNNQVGGGK